MRVPVLSAIVLAASVSLSAQAPTAVTPAQKAFEAGQYAQALQAIAADRQHGPTSPSEDYLAGQVYLKMSQNDKAKQEFAKLAASPDPIWKQIGQSAVALVDGSLDPALGAANQAVQQSGGAAPAAAPKPGTPAPNAQQKFHALYQLGLVKAKRNDWAGAADAFERAAQIDPSFAYAQYYAGLAYSHIKRPDKVATYFDHFMALAPNAPERSAVTSIMRTIRGK